ncbi:MAG: cryptochrome/photolyase family protein [Pseudomonadota bacterium]
MAKRKQAKTIDDKPSKRATSQTAKGTDGPRIVHILGDQLSPSIAALKAADKARDVVLLCEVHDETTYVRHHKKKIALILSAMRHFADELRGDGWTVDYVMLDDKRNSGSFRGEVGRAVERHGACAVIVTEPGEYRVRSDMDGWSDAFDVDVDILDDDRFVCSIAEFETWAKDRKALRMENFYREMRKSTGLLMDGDQPVGDKWNFDHDNRKPAKSDLFMPKRTWFEPDVTTQAVLDLVGQRFDNHFGDLEPFRFAVTRPDAEAVFQHFLDDCLERFGDYQDAMLEGEKFLYHSLVSFYINLGLLDPLDVCRRVEAAYHEKDAPLNAVEGFIRQIIGWREYVRGIYWLKMPDYAEENFFSHNRSLPDFYWTGETDMACVRAAVQQTKEEAYAHHIQRLMVTGNFAMLAGVDPHEVHEWYLAVYADAYEWVELPNVIGMSQFADGGLLGSKPYAASANYIDKMSDYCGGCAYDKKTKTKDDSCPFNYLYWDFLARNEDTLKSNRRMGMIYGTWGKMKTADKLSIRARSRVFLDDVAPEKG